MLADRFHHVLKQTPTEVRRALAYVLLNARKHYGSVAVGRRRWFWTARVRVCGSTAGRGAVRRMVATRDAEREPEVAAPRTWLLSKGWRRIGLVDPAEVPGG